MSSVIKQVKVISTFQHKQIAVKELPKLVTEPQEMNEENHAAISEQIRQEALLLRKQIQQEYLNHQTQMEKERLAWQEEMEKLKGKAYQEGYEQGFALGEQDGRSAYRDRIQEAEQMIKQIEQDYEKYIDSSEEDILELAIEVARAIMNHHLNEHQEDWGRMVKKAIQEVRDQETITITVDPEWFNHTNLLKDELVRLTYGAKISIYPDERLEKNSCIIETPFGKIDASLDLQLEEMRSKLSEFMRGAS